MIVSYLDTSAAMKLVFNEHESMALRDDLRDSKGRSFVASWLLHTELHCAVGRRGGGRPIPLAEVLERIDLVDVTRGDLLSAGTLAPLRAQDAIHLATAIRIGADEMVTYDRELAAAARGAGLRAVSPGAST